MQIPIRAMAQDGTTTTFRSDDGGLLAYLFMPELRVAGLCLIGAKLVSLWQTYLN